MIWDGALVKPVLLKYLPGEVLMSTIINWDFICGWQFISLWKPSLSLKCSILGNCYESYALYSFGCYLIACLGTRVSISNLLNCSVVAAWVLFFVGEECACAVPTLFTQFCFSCYKYCLKYLIAWNLQVRDRCFQILPLEADDLWLYCFRWGGHSDTEVR